MLRNQIDFSPGEFIVRENDVSDCAFVIMKGEVGIYKRGLQDKIIPLAILKPGEYLGELGVVSGQTRTAEAIAITDVSVVRITKELLEEELAKVPPWVSALLLGLVERLMKADELLRKHGTSDEILLRKIEPFVKNNLLEAKRKVG